MTPRDIPTHFDQLIAHLTARIVDYRDRRVRLTESDTIRELVLPVLQVQKSMAGLKIIYLIGRPV
jgi:hypothetical protein